MRRQFALRTKLLASAYDACAEDGLPISVSNHARGERIPLIQDPVGQLQAVGLISSRYAEHFRHALVHALAFLLIVTAQLNMRLAALGHLAHHRHGGGAFHTGELFFGRFQLPRLGEGPGVVGGEIIHEPFHLRHAAFFNRRTENAVHVLGQRLLQLG